LVYNPDKISIEQIHQLIAKAGHDTEKVKAPDSIYSKLPDCCLFREKPNTHHD
jgi:Cu(I)/Ag(I) efflux system membrane fusion protein